MRILTFIAWIVLASSPPAVEKAPELRKSEVWINSTPLTLKALKGKVVLIDFWAFDCEPCIQAIPHVIALHEKYASKGLVVIGVHTPRTKDERDAKKLREAVKRMKIPFPVVTDDNGKSFEDYRCDLWPTQFLIDREGNIRLAHGGVGRYVEIEELTQKLLGEL